MGRANIVILNCIAWTDHLHLLQTLNSSHQFKLDIFWKSIIQAIWIDDPTIYPFRFEPHLMGLFGGESDYFLLDSWAVSGSLTFPLVGFKYRQLITILFNQFMSFQVGGSSVAADELVLWLKAIILMNKGKRLDLLI
jgi:hypothetical protein